MASGSCAFCRRTRERPTDPYSASGLRRGGLLEVACRFVELRAIGVDGATQRVQPGGRRNAGEARIRDLERQVWSVMLHAQHREVHVVALLVGRDGNRLAHRVDRGLQPAGFRARGRKDAQRVRIVRGDRKRTFRSFDRACGVAGLQLRDREVVLAARRDRLRRAPRARRYSLPLSAGPPAAGIRRTG